MRASIVSLFYSRQANRGCSIPGGNKLQPAYPAAYKFRCELSWILRSCPPRDADVPRCVNTTGFHAAFFCQPNKPQPGCGTRPRPWAAFFRHEEQRVGVSGQSTAKASFDYARVQFCSRYCRVDGHRSLVRWSPRAASVKMIKPFVLKGRETRYGKVQFSFRWSFFFPNRFSS